MCAWRLAVLSHWLAQMAPFGSVFAERLGQPPRIMHVLVGVLVGHRRHLDQLGSEQAQGVLLLLALRLGDDDHGAEAERVADHGQADAGVAGRPFHHRAPGRKVPRRMASCRMYNAARSLTDWPGFMNSALPRMVQPVSSEARRSLMRGVRPTAATTPLEICTPWPPWSQIPADRSMRSGKVNPAPHPRIGATLLTGVRGCKPMAAQLGCAARNGPAARRGCTQVVPSGPGRHFGIDFKGHGPIYVPPTSAKACSGAMIGSGTAGSRIAPATSHGKRERGSGCLRAWRNW